MAINFAQLSATTRIPGVYVEVDNSNANTALEPQRTLIIGQITNQGTAVVDYPLISAGPAEAKRLGGPGSMLANMVAKYRATDTEGEIWYLPLDDDPASTQATGRLTFTAPATASGMFPLMIAGSSVYIRVTPTMTVSDLALAIVAAVGSDHDLPVTASAAAGVVTFTAKNGGLAAGDIDLRVAYRGSAGGEAVPDGMAFSITPMSGGTANPSLADALANITERTFDFIVCPFTDAANLNAIEQFLSDDSGRWSPTIMLYGHAWAAYRGSLAQCVTFGNSRNDQHLTVMGYYDAPEPAYLWAAAVTAINAISLRADPALPLQYQRINVLPPPEASRFVRNERNTLLYDGISTFTVNAAGDVITERLITTYQTNLAGAIDNSYLDTETPYTLMFGIRYIRDALLSQFARKKLVADGTKLTAGTNMVTSQTVLAAAITLYRTLCTAGIMQDAAGFMAEARGENAGNGRVNLSLPFRLANQLRIIAIAVPFTKP